MFEELRRQLGDALDPCHDNVYHLQRLLNGNDGVSPYKMVISSVIQNIEMAAEKYIEYRQIRRSLDFDDPAKVEYFYKVEVETDIHQFHDNTLVVGARSEIHPPIDSLRRLGE